ncbi:MULTISPECIES: hypothetical protein [unclassified Rhodococcus (in: high G+C Gram-positive bacteria)]|uniref:hypothetical protein n=1 Tax=unclassified Rhodococcus (in: high G+C Gram-positive bacteria) TaxID=192944 RepID=UPI0015C58494|nr:MULTISPECIES: hypothetical protein [unclassified Rhodococcus (in: high G+C Gram-positive bacteria)]
MAILVRSGLFTVLMFALFVLFDDRAVWKSLIGAVVAGAVFTLLWWFYERRAPDAASTE